MTTEPVSYTSLNHTTAQELLQLHRVEALAQHLASRLDGWTPNWRGSPLFIAGSRPPHAAPGRAPGITPRELRLQVLEAAELITPAERAALELLRTENPYGGTLRGDKRPLARVETLYVAVPEITITSRAGVVLVHQGEQVMVLDTEKHPAAWDLARTTRRSPLQHRMGRLHWRPKVEEHQRQAWLRLAGAVTCAAHESQAAGAA